MAAEALMSANKKPFQNQVDKVPASIGSDSHGHFCHVQSSRPDGRDDQPGGPLHDIIIGSDDEMESVLSGPMSDHGDTGQESATLLNESRWSSFGNR